jgi:hypothetical protein
VFLPQICPGLPCYHGAVGVKTGDVLVSNLDRLKEIFPEKTHLSPEDVALVLGRATDTVRKKIANGQLNAGFIKIAGSLLVSMGTFAKYLDSFEVPDEPVLLAKPISALSYSIEKAPRMRGRGRPTRVQGLMPSIGFDNGSMYSAKELLDASFVFHQAQNFELEAMFLKLSIWLMRLGVDVKQSDLIDFSKRIEAFAPSLEDVEATSKAFFTKAIIYFNTDNSDNIESLQALTLYLIEFMPRRMTQV